ncbi:MAG TPA: 2-hydroxyacyl-CoA dehydratase family protein [Syntrophales bacterium]|nr:2-hydroxyacyl-CoA dehydratase family protein [Syntrophales bacterium]
MYQLNEFYDVLNDPAAYGRRMKEDGRKVVGYFCSYTPEEIIYAAGAHPFRIFGTGESIHCADAHFQSYCCSLVRGALEGALSGSLDFLSGAVFPHTCDSIQRLSDIWRMNVKGPFHLDLVLPVKLDTESARMYMIDVLRKFRNDLASRLKAEITDERLAGAIGTFNVIRGALRRLYELKAENPWIIGGSDLYAIVKAAMIMDRNRLCEILPSVIRDIENKKGVTGDTASKRVVLAGGVCNNPDIYRIVEQSGGVVVWDDFCTGSRYFEETTKGNADPIASIAGRFLARPVCPAKHTGIFTRGENLLRIVREKNARGVVFFFLKFCDPHAFDYPYLKGFLDREGIPSMMFEVEDQLPSEGQLRTRFETFIDML